MRNVAAKKRLSLYVLKGKSCKTIVYHAVGIHKNSTVTQNQGENQFSTLASYVTSSCFLQECVIS